MRSDAGDTDRTIAQVLSISPSCLSKWRKLRRKTGALQPGKMNGHKKPTLSGGMPGGCASDLPRRRSPPASWSASLPCAG